MAKLTREQENRLSAIWVILIDAQNAAQDDYRLDLIERARMSLGDFLTKHKPS